jgi:hypothetical protein
VLSGGATAILNDSLDDNNYMCKITVEEKLWRFNEERKEMTGGSGR